MSIDRRQLMASAGAAAVAAAVPAAPAAAASLGPVISPPVEEWPRLGLRVMTRRVGLAAERVTLKPCLLEEFLESPSMKSELFYEREFLTDEVRELVDNLAIHQEATLSFTHAECEGHELTDAIHNVACVMNCAKFGSGALSVKELDANLPKPIDVADPAQFDNWVTECNMVRIGGGHRIWCPTLPAARRRARKMGLT